MTEQMQPECRHWIGAESRYCKGVDGVRRFLPGPHAARPARPTRDPARPRLAGPPHAGGEVNQRRPGQWPVNQPADLELVEPSADELYVQRAQERALHEMVLDSIRHDLEQQPSPVCVLTTARNWCSHITAAAEDVARAKRRAA